MWNQSSSASRDAILGIGAQAPRFLFWEDPRDHEMQLHAMNGRPVVVSFSPQWSGDAEPELAAALSGLGAALIVVTPDSIWLHRAGSAAGRYDFGAMLGTSRDLVHYSFGIRPNDKALFVLDARNIVRWRSDGAGVGDNRDASQAVLAALNTLA